MYRKIYVLSIMVWLLTAVNCTQSFAQYWTIQPAGSSVSFKIRNAGLWVNGSFEAFTASIHFDQQKLAEASISGILQVKTIDTGIGLRNKHLRSAEYFNEARFPTITFTSSAIFKDGDAYIAKGKLTIKEVTRQVDIPFTFDEKAKSGVFKAQLTLNRREYGVGTNSWTLGDEVMISIVLTTRQMHMNGL